MLKNLRDLVISSSIFASGVYGYLYYKTSNNLKELTEHAEANKDNTRPDNESFGINWGWRTDDVVMNQIDTADLIFLKFDCGQTTSVGDFLRCYKHTWSTLDHEYNSIAVAYRDEEGVQILLNQFGITAPIGYPNLVAKPYISELSFRKIRNMNPQIQKKFQPLMESYVKNNRVETNQKMLNQVFSSMGQLKHEIEYINQIANSTALKLRSQFDNKVFVRTTVAKHLRNA